MHNDIRKLHLPFSSLAVEEVPELRARHGGEGILEQAVEGVLLDDIGLHLVVEAEERRQTFNPRSASIAVDTMKWGLGRLLRNVLMVVAALWVLTVLWVSGLYNALEAPFAPSSTSTLHVSPSSTVIFASNVDLQEYSSEMMHRTRGSTPCQQPPLRVPPSPSLAQTRYGGFSYQPFHHRARTAPEADDITMVLQTSSDRLSRAIRIARIWKGPVSVTLFVRHLEKDMRVLHDVMGRAQEMREWADVHIFYDKAHLSPRTSDPR